ncbi:hypothetical protein ACJRO7_002112 [Eucalyptus globulus]|uniref:Uncharacterized protein n=1 Tax=Eucalyptus globulus TaxID=34317 RepID=A0ABD3M365_EUCGL
MELGARLRIQNEEFLSAQKTWSRYQHKLTISEAERQHYKRLHDEAEKALRDTVQEVKNQRALVLHNVEDAKAFMKIMPAHFQDHGRLEQVEVYAELPSSMKTAMHKILGANLYLTNTV